MGSYTVAEGDLSTASGESTWAYGYASSATGVFSQATGEASLAAGSLSVASGFAATAFGINTTANKMGSFAAGIGTVASSYGSAAFGSYNLGVDGEMNWDEQDSLFEVGNSFNPTVRSNALTILKNGATTLTNKAWKGNQNGTSVKALENPAATTDSNGEALIVEGHTRLKGKVTIEAPQGNISMGIYGTE